MNKSASNQNRTLKNIAEHGLFLVFATLARILPRSLALRLGDITGRLVRHLLVRRSDTARENIACAFPEHTPAQVEQLVADTFSHVGISAMEMLRLDTLHGERDLKRYFTFEGLENLSEAYRMGRGVLLITGHVGFWEVGTFFLPLLGFPADFVAKRMKNPYTDRYFTRMREAAGGRCLDSKKGARRILRSLGEGRGVCVLMDQHIFPREGIEVSFFGRPATTTPIIAQIAMKQQVPVVPIFVYRIEGNRYQVVAEPMLIFAKSGEADAVQRYTQAITDRIEKAIRRQPDQWLWLHRRWRADKKR